MQAFIARQPIFDRKLNVVAYELLFRDGLDNVFDFSNGTEATSRVIVNSFLNFDFESLTRGKRAFINVDRNILVRDYLHLFSPEHIVPEILETVRPDKEVLTACQELKQKGFELSLDDVIEYEDVAELAQYLDIVKVDFSQTDAEQQSRLAHRCHAESIKVLAEKVETKTEFLRAERLGYHFFQGFFFSQPTLLARKDIAGNKLHYLELLRLINGPSIDFEGLSKVIQRDLSLSYRLLRYVNARSLTWQREIRSLHQALVALGIDSVKNWASLVTVSILADDTPDELLRLSISRARFCELLAGRLSRPDMSSDVFLVGMLSLLDVILDVPMAELLETVPLSPNIRQALLGTEGFEGQLLDLVTAYEKAAWSDVASISGDLGMEMGDLPDLFIEALDWSNESFASEP